ncbi:MAG: hypothetical protein ACI8RZ_003299 [Myxococcota bacterium]|jgi:hypothetical protein
MSTLLLALLVGCKSETASQCSPSADAGTLSATIDGTDWLGEGLTWLWSGDSVQLTTSGTDRITAVAHRDADGLTVSERIDSLPITVSLDDDSGWAVLYEGSESARSVGGSMVITEHTDGGALGGCLSFEADDGTLIEDGSFSAEAAGD